MQNNWQLEWNKMSKLALYTQIRAIKYNKSIVYLHQSVVVAPVGELVQPLQVKWLKLPYIGCPLYHKSGSSSLCVYVGLGPHIPDIPTVHGISYVEYTTHTVSAMVLLQVDIGQGWKPPGHYVQRSCGLFPAPYPQNYPEVDSVCWLFELLGIFVAKCIQDKRRVDLPLSRPFFKLMAGTPRGQCHPLEEEELGLPGTNGDLEGAGGGGGEGGSDSAPARETRPGDNQRAAVEENEAENDSRGGGEEDGSNRGGQNNVVLVTPRGEAQAASLKEAELLLATTGEGEEEITKDRGGEKEELLVLEELGETGGGGGGGEGEGEVAWFKGILQMEDLEEVNPHR